MEDEMRSAILILALLSPPAHAELDYCTPKNRVDPYVQYCYQNDYFVKAADLCLDKFQSEVNSFQKKLTNSFRYHDSASVSAQHRKLDNTAQDLSDTDATLRELIQRAKYARENILRYRKTIILPGAANPEELGAAYRLYADTPCYRENRQALEGRVALLDKKITELSQTKAATDSMRLTTDARLTNLNLNSGTPELARRSIASPTRAQGSARPAVPQGRSLNSASTITGDIKWGELGQASK